MSLTQRAKDYGGDADDEDEDGQEDKDVGTIIIRLRTNLFTDSSGCVW